VEIAVNELSFATKCSVSDIDLLRQLGATLAAIRGTVPSHLRAKVIFRAPEIMGPSPRLPGGQSVSKALEHISGDERTWLLTLLDFPGIPCEAPAKYRFLDEPAYGLGYALRGRGLTASLSSPAWSIDILSVTSTDPDIPGGSVPNAWKSDLAPAHRTAISQHLDVLPGYYNPGTHDPESHHYDPRKSHIPTRAAWILSHAHVHQEVWWASLDFHGPELT